MVPLMSGQLRLAQHRAHGTSLAIIVFVAVAGAIGIAPTSRGRGAGVLDRGKRLERSDARVLKRI